jgi:hypothetical protein
VISTLVLAAAQSLPAIIGVFASSGQEQVVVVRVEPELGGLDFTQTGSTVELYVKGSATPMLEAPPPSQSIESVQLDRTQDGIRLRLGLAAGVHAVLRRSDQSTLTLALQVPEPAEVVAEARSDEAPPSVEQLFPLLFPAGAPEDLSAQDTPNRDEPDEDGLRLGFITLRPGLELTYVDATATFLDTPEPSQTSYFQIEPRLEALAAVRVGSGLLTARYEPSFRRGSDFSLVNQPTHVAEATLNLPLTPVSTFDGAYRFVRGTLEAREVDPGDEFFFGLGRFTRHGATAGVEVETGSRTALEVNGYFDDIAFDRRDRGFFSHQRYGADAGLRYEVGPTLRALLGYAWDAIPEPVDRSLAEARAHTAFLRLEGELGALTSGSARFGFRHQTNPNGFGDGSSWDGFVVSASLKRDFSRASWVRLGAERTTFPSAFQSDGFYVSSSVLGQLQVPLPLSVAFTGGASYRWNDYRIAIAELGGPRADEIFGWSVGLARSLSPWAFLRADYRKDYRRSNVDAFDLDTHSLTLQLGLSPFREPQR